MARARSIQPLDGGYDGYIDILYRIRDYVEKERPRDRVELKSWYVRTLGTPERTIDAYINSLFRSGLLGEKGDRVKCLFPKRKNEPSKIIATINENIVFILDMLSVARDGVSEEDLHSVGKLKYGLGAKSNVTQIRWRRGWLQSAGMLEVGAHGLLHPTDAGLNMLSESHHSDPPGVRELDLRRKVNRAEFGGKGEGPDHRSLKEYVWKNCDRVLSRQSGRKVVTSGSGMEHRLPSGDSVDVTAWDRETIWHLEVKSRVSAPQDIQRGVFQCIKYAAVGRALEKLVPDGRRRTVKAILVVESALPSELSSTVRRLKVPVYRLGKSMRRTLRNTDG